MIQYAVFHMEKGTSSATSLGHHIDRTAGKEHSFRHADPARLGRNRSIPSLDEVELQQAVTERIKAGYTGTTAIRKDAVKHISCVLSGSHEKMCEIFRNKEDGEAWIKANYQWACQEFGKENIVRFTLHMDEKTPHIHLVVVPLTKEGRLSAKEVMGNPKKMSERQTRYANAMKPFGLQRGVEGSTIKHTNTKWYYGQLQKGLDEVHFDVKATKVETKAYQIEGKPSLFENWDKWKESQNKAILDHLSKTMGKVYDEVIKPLETSLMAFKQHYQHTLDSKLKESRELFKQKDLKLKFFRDKVYQLQNMNQGNPPEQGLNKGQKLR